MASSSSSPTLSCGELPIIQATMDLILWFVPLLNRLPRDHRFALGDRLVQGLYDLLEGLVTARYATAKLERLCRWAFHLYVFQTTRIAQQHHSPDPARR
jgi:hypothetical protein